MPHPVSVAEDRPYALPEWREGEFLNSLNQLGLDTNQPGTYTITGLYQQQAISGEGLAKRFDRWVDIEMWGGIIASNTITVQVEKAKPAISKATAAERIRKLELRSRSRLAVTPRLRLRDSFFA